MPPDTAETIEIIEKPITRKKGPKKRHSGMFSGGPDPRRWTQGPRSPVVKKSFQEAVQAHSDTAIQILAECMEDNQAAWRERRAAAELVLAHAVGAPVSRILMASAGSNGSDAKQLDSISLLARANQLLNAPELIQESPESSEYPDTQRLCEPSEEDTHQVIDHED